MTPIVEETLLALTAEGKEYPSLFEFSLFSSEPRTKGRVRSK